MTMTMDQGRGIRVRGKTRLFAAIALVLVGAATAEAQGALSTQGFGYPSGQISTRVRAIGGAAAEFDPISTLNPASLSEWVRASLYIQYEPEFRRLTNGAASDQSTIIRFPLFAGGLPVSTRATLGLSASTLLDRSWSTRSTGQQVFDTTLVDYTDVFQSLGALTDVRLAGGFAPSRTLRVGVGLHAITGQNRLLASRTFDSEQATFAPFGQVASVTYSGSAISAGFSWRPMRSLGLAGSAKRGFALKASVNDTSLGDGRVPDRVGAGARLELFTGTELYVRADRVWWSLLTPLSASGGAGTAVGQDSWELGAGLEGRGPTIFTRPVHLRLGADRRTLPFLAAGSEVREFLIAGGFGVPLAFGRSTLDAAVQRAARNSDIGVSERAWTISVGLTVRP
jgi:hypothetical protein